jgi:hypothetical protein
VLSPSRAMALDWSAPSSGKDFFKREWTVDMPEELPLEVSVFIVWLVVILWKRAESAAAAGGAGAADG